MKLNYQIILVLLIVVGVLVFIWNTYFSSIDIRYVNIGDTYAGVTVGDSVSQSVTTIISGEVSTDIKKTTCVSSDGNIRVLLWPSVGVNVSDVLGELDSCYQVTFYLSKKMPNYLLLLVDESSNVKEIHRFRFLTEGP